MDGSNFSYVPLNISLIKKKKDLHIFSLHLRHFSFAEIFKAFKIQTKTARFQLGVS